MFTSQQGIFYFLTHPFLYPLLRARLLPCFLLSLFVLATLFFWTYIPQVALLAVFHGTTGAWINGTILVLGEASAIIALLFEAFFVDETQVDIFDSVLVEKQHEDLVRASRPVLDFEVETDPLRRLDKPIKPAVYGPFSLRQTIEFIAFLPLNLIPWVGVPLFIFLVGRRAGPLLQWRYFQLREFDRKERNDFIKHYRTSYTMFGIIALILQLVPVMSMLFLLTTAAGSAILASNLERQRKHSVDAVADEPQYADDPV
ncbi:MAG: hypothetical protein M1821_008711 [Bathelium mastoideum]|nr:MAG: hypothetical protein M1821_008711 [Bathelium mastoideum]KAI9685871.1 MAG: hypothetical protein M1822_004149 [Bathelium mastoideum]